MTPLETQISSTTLIPTSTISPSTATMITNPRGTTMTPGVTDNPTLSTKMEMPEYFYIAIGGGAAGGFLILVIILLLAVVCCLSAKVMKSKRYGNYKIYYCICTAVHVVFPLSSKLFQCV